MAEMALDEDSLAVRLWLKSLLPRRLGRIGLGWRFLSDIAFSVWTMAGPRRFLPFEHKWLASLLPWNLTYSCCCFFIFPPLYIRYDEYRLVIRSCCLLLGDSTAFFRVAHGAYTTPPGLAEMVLAEDALIDTGIIFFPLPFLLNSNSPLPNLLMSFNFLLIKVLFVQQNCEGYKEVA